MKVLVVTNMYPSEEKPAFGTFVHDQVESLRAAGIEAVVLTIDGSERKLAYLWGIFRFWSTLLRSRFDLVHAHYAITGFVARLQLSHPLVVTYHGGEVKDHSPWWLRSLARQGPKLFDRIIVTNEIEREIIQHDAKVRVIPCGVDMDEFRPMSQVQSREARGLPPDRPLVLWAGEHWQWEKRIDLVEASIAQLKHRLPQVELVIVSGQPHSVIPVYMNACDALLLASRSEGSPMVVKEAMACNMPIVSTDVGDVAQVIQGVDGCYLAEPDPEDIATKLYWVLEPRRRTNGRERIRHLSLESIADQLMAIYCELCPTERCPA